MTENKQKLSFFTWIKTYPIKAMIFLLAIIIPLIVIFLFVIKVSNNNIKFYFDVKNDKPVYLSNKNISSVKDFEKYFEEFEIVVNKVVYNYDNEEEPFEVYEFENNFKLNKTFKQATVNYRAVLATKHYERQSEPTVANSPTSIFTINYPFNHHDNKTKALFLKSNFPVLIVEITITPSHLGLGAGEPIVLYYKLDLNEHQFNVE